MTSYYWRNILLSPCSWESRYSVASGPGQKIFMHLKAMKCITYSFPSLIYSKAAKAQKQPISDPEIVYRACPSVAAGRF